MIRSIRNLAVAVLGGVALAAPAQAQVGFRVGLGFNPTGNPFSLYGPYPGWNGSIGVTLGGVGSGYMYSFSALRPGGASPYTGIPAFYTRSSGVGLTNLATPVATGSRIVGQQRNAIAAAQRNAEWDRGAAGPAQNMEKWLNEQAQPRDAKELNAGPKLDPALIHPTDDAILSGTALNELIAVVGELERSGKKAEPGLCAPELMTKLVFEGGAAADAANQFRTAELTFPAALKVVAFDNLRAGLEKAYAPVVSAAYAGKRVTAADAERLLKETAKARLAAGDLVKDVCVDDAHSVCGFFNRLESSAKYIQEANATGVAGVKWSAVGATVDELGRHLTKYKLRFGKAADGDEAAYYSLHRGLLAYYAGLSQAK